MKENGKYRLGRVLFLPWSKLYSIKIQIIRILHQNTLTFSQSKIFGMPLFLIQFHPCACGLCWKRFGFLSSIPLWLEWCFRFFTDLPFIFISPVLPLTFHCRGCPVFYSHFLRNSAQIDTTGSHYTYIPLNWQSYKAHRKVIISSFLCLVKAFASELEKQLHKAVKVKKKTEIIIPQFFKYQALLGSVYITQNWPKDFNSKGSRMVHDFKSLWLALIYLGQGKESQNISKASILWKSST